MGGRKAWEEKPKFDIDENFDGLRWGGAVVHYYDKKRDKSNNISIAYSLIASEKLNGLDPRIAQKFWFSVKLCLFKAFPMKLGHFEDFKIARSPDFANFGKIIFLSYVHSMYDYKNICLISTLSYSSSVQFVKFD